MSKVTVCSSVHTKSLQPSFQLSLDLKNGKHSYNQNNDTLQLKSYLMLPASRVLIKNSEYTASTLCACIFNVNTSTSNVHQYIQIQP